MAWIDTKHGALNTQRAKIGINSDNKYAEVQVDLQGNKYGVYRGNMTNCQKFLNWLNEKIDLTGDTGMISLTDFNLKRVR